jgi:hypothetical protein
MDSFGSETCVTHDKMLFTAHHNYAGETENILKSAFLQTTFSKSIITLLLS